MEVNISINGSEQDAMVASECNAIDFNQIFQMPSHIFAFKIELPVQELIRSVGIISDVSMYTSLGGYMLKKTLNKHYAYCVEVKKNQEIKIKCNELGDVKTLWSCQDNGEKKKEKDQAMSGNKKKEEKPENIEIEVWVDLFEWKIHFYLHTWVASEDSEETTKKVIRLGNKTGFDIHRNIVYYPCVDCSGKKYQFWALSV